MFTLEARKLKALLAMVGLLSACPAHAQQPPPLPCTKGDVKCATVERLKTPVRNKSYWSAALARPLEQRFGAAPDELLVYINLDNMVQGYPNTPHTVALPPELLKDIGDAIAELPAPVKALVDRKLAGIYFVKDLGGTGFTDYAYGGWFSRDAGYIVLDMDVLSRQTANAWATWKENTPFRSDPVVKLEAVIETTAQDNRKNAIQYILLHELGHILSIGEKIHPVWDKPPSSEPDLGKYPFAHHSWKIDYAFHKYSSRFDTVFTERQDVKYYLGAKLDGKAMVPVYEKLEHTNFPTLYATINPGDDFAESFASYVHTVLMKRPWEIRLYRDGTLAKSFRLCWEEPRCAEKRRLLEGILGITR